uniref:Curli production assembly/transport component CsgG n=1 Tax=Roseihalotalea indica TaxID=2867963 RepID=A0AA49PZH4_9BACT|nr:hypothetical protein K4G66_13755 [Tunicatimonas sp. TK19036]
MKAHTTFCFWLTVIVCFWASACLAQPTTWESPYQVEQGKRDGYYVSQAKKLMKKEAYNASVANAVAALAIVDKKRQIRKAQEALREAYPSAISSSEARISALKASSADFKDDNTVNARYEIVKLYQEMVDFTNALKALPPETLESKKKDDLTFTYNDYSNDLVTAEQLLQEGKQLAAEKHYTEAGDLMASNDIESNKKAAKKYDLATQYIPGFKNANEKYEEARALGTTRMFITDFRNKSGIAPYNHLGAKVSSHIATTISNNGPYEFFELVHIGTVMNQTSEISSADQAATGMTIGFSAEQLANDILGTQSDTNTPAQNASPAYTDEDDGALIEHLLDQNVHLIMRGEITRISTAKNNNDPVTETIEKEIVLRKEKYKDSEGKEKEREIKGKVAARYTTYSREATAMIEGVYHIVDLATGNIIETQSITGTYKFYDDWASYSGDERALSKYQKSKAKEKPVEFPRDETMIYSASDDYSKEASNSALQYVTVVGS